MKRQTKTSKLTVGAMLTAMCIMLPQVFHLTGIPQVGSVFLPMHIPVFLSGFLLGPIYGGIIGAISPLISFLITNMPTSERMPFMVIELACYGIISGLFYNTFKFNSKKFGTIISLTFAMLIGRVVYAFSLFIAAKIFNVTCGGAVAALTATVTGIYGIVLQLITIPPIIYVLKSSTIKEKSQ